MLLSTFSFLNSSKNTIRCCFSKSFSGNLSTSQITYPISDTNNLGYSSSATNTLEINRTVTTVQNFTLPSKGVWLVIVLVEWETLLNSVAGDTGNGTVQDHKAVVSTGSSSMQEISTLLYSQKNDVTITASQNFAVITLTGIVTVSSGVLPLYVNVDFNFSNNVKIS